MSKIKALRSSLRQVPDTMSNLAAELAYELNLTFGANTKDPKVMRRRVRQVYQWYAESSRSELKKLRKLMNEYVTERYSKK